MHLDKVRHKTGNAAVHDGVISQNHIFRTNSGVIVLTHGCNKEKKLLKEENFKSLSSVLPKNIISIAVGGIDEKKFISWLHVNISGFGLGSNLYKPGMLIEEVKLKAQQIVRSYDESIMDIV